MAQKQKSTPERRTPAGASWFDKLPSGRKDLIAIGILLLLVYFLFWKIIVNNMIFSDSGDTAANEALTSAIQHIEKTENIEPIWIPYYFSGMPVFGSLLFPKMVNYCEWLLQVPGRLLFLFSDYHWFVLHYFLMGLFTYLLARQLKLSQFPSLLAGITMMLNPYAIGLAQAGHGSKLVVLSYIPLLFLLTHALFEKRNLLTFSLLAATVGTMLLNRHPQMAFYGFLLIGIYLLFEVVRDIRTEPKRAVWNVLLFVLAVGIGFVIYSYEFLPTQEYARYSIRGGSGEGALSGLSYDYATGWSLHPLEMITYVIPSFFGFSSQYVTDWQGQQLPLPLYWGWMPFTDNPPYIGIVPLLLGIIALIYRRNRMTWFLGILSILVFLISFGGYFGIVYNFLFNYLPYFNKFRAPSMILYLIPLTFGLLAAYGASWLMEAGHSKETNAAHLQKRFTRILLIVLGLIVVVFIGKSAIHGFTSDFMFGKQGEVQQYGDQVVKLFKEKRFDVLFNDVIKTGLFIAAMVGLIVLYFKRSIHQTTMLAGFIAILLVDLVTIDLTFINPKPNSALKDAFKPDATVEFLKNDTTLYRVLPLGQRLFMDNTYMYHLIPTAAGYSPAKLKIYQEMIDSCLFHGADPQFPINMGMVNMLNVKYLIAEGRLPEGTLKLANVDQSRSTITYENTGMLPRAWFVDGYTVATPRRAVFNAINDPGWNPRLTAILEKEPGKAVGKSDSTSVQVLYAGAHRIALKVYTKAQALMVLSEVYYPAGWNATVDGVATEIYKTNYILRSVAVPPGGHTIEFTFAPATYQLGYTITQISWGLTFVLILAGALMNPVVRKRIGLGKGAGSPEVLRGDQKQG